MSKRYILSLSDLNEYSNINLFGSQRDAHAFLESSGFAVEVEEKMPSHRVLSTFRAIMHAVVECTSNGHQSKAYHSTIALKCGHTRETVNRYLMDAVHAGIIHSENRFIPCARGGNEQTSNKTTFLSFRRFLARCAGAARQRAGEVLRRSAKTLSQIVKESSHAVAKAISNSTPTLCDLAPHTLILNKGSSVQADKSTGEITTLPAGHNLPPDIYEAFKDLIGVPA